MANLELFLIFAFQCIIFTSAGYIQDKLIDGKTVKFVRCGQCPRTHLPYQFYMHVGKSTLRTAYITNATLIAKENLKDKLMISYTITRCRSRENLDSCEDYYKIRNLDYCKSISDDFLLPGSNPLLVPYEPKLKCPIKQAIYHAYNFTFNLTPFLMLNLDGWYWKFNMDLVSPTENNRRLMCTIAEAYTQL